MNKHEFKEWYRGVRVEVREMVLASNMKLKVGDTVHVPFMRPFEDGSMGGRISVKIRK